jgi:hypothetical protein
MVLGLVVISGCTRPLSSPASENLTVPVQTTAPTVPTLSPTIQPSLTTIAPQKVIVTLGPLKTIKDSELWFTMQVPESWKVTTERISNPEGYEGLGYETILYNNEFFILTYAISRSQDQSFRGYYRDKWTPLPNESTVVINGITFDRFESKTDNDVKVAYVVRKISANERGFASVIGYSLNTSSEYQQVDFESLISTFDYKDAKEIKSAVGEEIKS